MRRKVDSGDMMNLGRRPRLGFQKMKEEKTSDGGVERM